MTAAKRRQPSEQEVVLQRWQRQRINQAFAFYRAAHPGAGAADFANDVAAQYRRAFTARRMLRMLAGDAYCGVREVEAIAAAARVPAVWIACFDEPTLRELSALARARALGD